MNKYRIIKELGNGSFGSVLQAENLEKHEMVDRDEILTCAGNYESN